MKQTRQKLGARVSYRCRHGCVSRGGDSLTLFPPVIYIYILFDLRLLLFIACSGFGVYSIMAICMVYTVQHGGCLLDIMYYALYCTVGPMRRNIGEEPF